FLELELFGPSEQYVDAARGMGIHCEADGRRRIRMVLPPSLTIRTLYDLANAHDVQIRHLDFKRDSLQDIFDKAMREG
ncbi:MAG: ABC transporter ATP-binding protein, partial [Acidobacteriota bacterium]